MPIMKSFIGVLYLSGYHKIARQHLMLSLENDVTIPIVQESISRKDFNDLKSIYHFNDNNGIENTTDKLFKVRKLIQFANNAAKEVGLKANDKLSVDESMIRYYSRNRLKQVIRNKPIRFGYKAWCLCSSDGYLIDFDIYQGAEDDGPKTLGARVIDERLSRSDVYGKLDAELYFDNFFTSYDVMAYLKTREVKATGTVRKDRTKKCPAIETDLRERGSFDLRKADDILCVAWKDNSSVTLLSNFDSVYPLGTAQRYSRREKAKVAVPMPNVVKSYNMNMGGVDTLDS